MFNTTIDVLHNKSTSSLPPYRSLRPPANRDIDRYKRSLDLIFGIIVIILNAIQIMLIC